MTPHALTVGAWAAVGLVLSQVGVPLVAESVPAVASYEPWAQLVGSGVCGVLLAWTLIRTIPDMIRTHATTLKELSKATDDRNDKLVEAIEQGNREQLTVLRQALLRQPPHAD